MKTNQTTRRHELLAAVLVSGVVGFGSGWLGAGTRFDELQPTNYHNQQQFISGESELISKIAEEVGQSVVSINLTSSQPSLFGVYSANSAGTGIILNEDGVIITNRHVISEDSEQIEVTLSDGTVYDDVEIIGRDPRAGVDIAFLKIRGASGLKPAKIGNSDDMKVGDSVIAIGNALGEYQNSVTTGIISGRSRPVVAGDSRGAEALTNLLQTDAAINPGNSGGPLVNINGEVIGINTAVARGENIGFAIPISDVAGSINSVIKSGKLVVPYIGVRYEQIDEAYAEEYNLDVSQGAYVRGRQAQEAVLPNSPAEKAGVQEHDIITAVDGVSVDSNNGLSTLVGRKSVGDKLKLAILRDGQELTLELTVEATPEAL